MTEMLDRAVEAMQKRSVERFGKPVPHHIAHHLAAAVIEAMETPTEDMVRAAHRSTAGWLGLPGPASGLSQALFKHEHRYKAMIRAALAPADRGSPHG
jgi:hypothetical protein